MSTYDPKVSRLPYQADEGFEMRVLGRWREGGVVEILHHGDLIDVVALPPAEWSVLALLVIAAHRSRDTNWADAFLSPKHLARELARVTNLVNPQSDNVIKFVYKLRRLLSETGAVEEAIENAKNTLGKKLLEHRRFLGYRISLPPDQLHLHVIDGESQGNHLTND